MALNLNYSNSATLNWTKEYLMEVLTGGSKPLLTDPLIINAFLRVDRADFIPESKKYLAYNDVSIDIGNDVKLERPIIVAKILSLLNPQFGGNYLILGSSSGYITTLLSFIASDQGKVYSVEKFKLINDIAKENIAKYKHTNNVELLVGKVEDGLAEHAPYTGILSIYKVNTDKVKTQLKEGGNFLSVGDNGSMLLVQKTNSEFEEESIE